MTRKARVPNVCGEWDNVALKGGNSSGGGLGPSHSLRP